MMKKRGEFFKTGAWGETRTRTERFNLPRDFKSLVSTISPPRPGIIVTQLVGFCQFDLRVFCSVFLSLAFLGISSCSFAPKNVDKNSSNLEKMDELAQTATQSSIGPFWFSTQERFRSYDEEGQLAVHPFFDFDPFENQKSFQFQFFPLTPENSPYRYEFELSSGRSYKSFNYCEQKDVWGKYDEKLTLPSFTEGFIPRFIDEQGRPQRVIVFGNAGYYLNEEKNDASPLSSVRLIGGVYEQFCRNYPCLDQEKWTTRLELIAVDERDERYQSVMNLSDLKKKVDWSYVKAFLQNSQGRTLQAAGQYPAYRILGELEKEKAFEYAKSRGHLFQKDELQKLRKNCEGLYDSIFNSAQKVREEMSKNKIFQKKGSGDSRFLFWSEHTFIGDDYIKGLATLPTVSKRNVWKYGDELVEELKKEEEKIRQTKAEELRKSLKASVLPKLDPVIFTKVFLQKYLNPYSVCERYVRPSSINNENQERHWFFIHLSAFSHALRLGNYYNCGKKAWLDNPLRADGKYEYDPYVEFLKCGNYDIDDAFAQAVKVLVMKSKNNQEHYSYIEYDNARGGSHRKIHNWTYFTGKELSCLKKDENLMNTQPDKDRLQFPEDVTWNPLVPYSQAPQK